MVHLYCGDGKGKTTAAMGLALRELGHDRRVCIVQFLKDASSGEIQALRRFSNVTVFACDPGITFSFRMDAQQREAARSVHEKNVERACRLIETKSVDMVVLDEVCAAVSTGLLEPSSVLGLIDMANRADPAVEVVMTGRDPAPELIEAADYVTNMTCVRHPFERGIAAREGIEY